MSATPPALVRARVRVRVRIRVRVGVGVRVRVRVGRCGAHEAQMARRAHAEGGVPRVRVRVEVRVRILLWRKGLAL